MSFKLHIRFFFTWIFSVYLLAVSAVSEAQPGRLNLATVPLFLGNQVDPNVFFMLDDSGSMDWEVLILKEVYHRDYWGDAYRRGDDNYSDGRIGVITDCQDGKSGCVKTGNLSHKKPSYKTGNYQEMAYIFKNDDNVQDNWAAALAENPNWGESDWRIRSAAMNAVYYNPAITYKPWEGFLDAKFEYVASNPQPNTYGFNKRKNLGNENFKYEVWTDNLGRNGVVNGPSSVGEKPNGKVDLWDSHTTYSVSGSDIIKIEELTTTFAGVKSGKTKCSFKDTRTSPPYKDCFGTTSIKSSLSGAVKDDQGRTVPEVKQNIANWYQYHRRRSFVAKDAIEKVIAANTSFRFGLSVINQYDKLFVGVPSSTQRNYADHNTGLIMDLLSYPWTSKSTPLRSGLERVGRYYANQLKEKDPIISACQQNYSILFSDGYWVAENKYGGPDPFRNRPDADGDGSKYSVADVAKAFYAIDLRSNLANVVPTSSKDPNNAQHMVTFTVSFGVEGNLFDLDNNQIPDTDWTGDVGTTVTESSGWHRLPRGTDSRYFSNAEKVDDLWHAAFNSKGYYASARSPADLAEAISDALSEIADRVGSATSVATNTGSLNAGSKLFQARFDSSGWAGQLLAFQIDSDGSIQDLPEWEAGEILDAKNWDTDREIITFNPGFKNAGGRKGTGVPFRFPSNYESLTSSNEISSGQVNFLLGGAPYPGATLKSEKDQNQAFGVDLVNYLRGDRTNENSDRNFRVRSSILGDIANSDPQFVGASNGGYPDSLEPSDSYSMFTTGNENRKDVVYVGANDGMLHGFDADTGDELIAYVPSGVYNSLDDLASSAYAHRYFVDASPNIIDVFLDTGDGQWRTVLVGGLNGGGQQIYALDVTNPSDFSEENAANIVLWEFDDSDSADLGYTYGRPQIAKMANGKWAAIFGNGYNSTEAGDGSVSKTGHGVLFIVDVETGILLKKIDTFSGAVNAPNGLATPLLIDSNGDSIVDYIYAGDLLGNLWKFDVTNVDATRWEIAGGAGLLEPLFETLAGQPITSQPQATMHPDNLGGFMIFFGTGKYLEVNDNNRSDQDTQSFYGIWDKNIVDVETGILAFQNTDVSNLLTQSITNQYDQSFNTDGDGSGDKDFKLRDVSDEVIDWDTHHGWVLDLVPQNIYGSENDSNDGERQVSNAIVRNGRVLFSTLTPSAGECDFGGSSFLMQVDFRDGSALEFPAFDLNGDGEFDTDDTNASGRASNVGVMPSVSILADGPQDVAFGSGASGDIEVFKLNVGSQAYGRQSWRQLE